MSKKKVQFEDRIRFNWGYHDSRVEHAENRPRVLEYTSKSDIKHVSIKRDAAYFHGYRLGRRHHWDNVPHTTSDQAWSQYQVGE
jgi:hypothetical protein